MSPDFIPELVEALTKMAALMKEASGPILELLAIVLKVLVRVLQVIVQAIE